ncbi:hypothetical protein IPM62_00205 [Candidatus Woesebacteria bacterium]|nr:MAG: hypothetical protein IPM62_00205 [Candidatus Woesebacteria bacterium]
MKTINTIKKLHIPIWLFCLLVGVLVLRIPSLFEPYYYGDEMIYLALGNAIKKGMVLYKSIHDNKPPLLYLTAAIAGNLFWFRAILAIWHLMTVFVFWKLVRVLYPKKINLQKVSTCVFALLTTLPLLEGNIANSEMFMIGPTMVGFLILLRKNQISGAPLVAGLAFSIGALFKIPAAFDMPAIVLFWIITQNFSSKDILITIKKTVLLAVGFAVPILVTFVYYYFRGALSEYFIAAFGQNFGYLSSFRPDDTREPFLTRNGPLIFRGLTLLSGLGVLFLARKKLSKQFIFLTTWLLLTMFAVTLSERPYPHYLIQSIPVVSIMIGILFTNKKIEQTLVIIPLLVFFAIPVYYKFWYYPSAPYYVRYLDFVSGKITLDQYRSAFGNNVNVDYKVARFVIDNTTKDDKIFVWGDNAAIYAITNRFPPFKYVVDYHINDFSTQEDTIQALNADLPKFIVILPNSQEFPDLVGLIKSKYGTETLIDGAQIWRLLNTPLRENYIID